MDTEFEERFYFETNLPPPNQPSFVKRKKSFSDIFFKKAGTSFKLSSKNASKLRQKFAFKLTPAPSDIFGDFSKHYLSQSMPLKDKSSSDSRIPLQLVSSAPEKLLSHELSQVEASKSITKNHQASIDKKVNQIVSPEISHKVSVQDEPQTPPIITPQNELSSPFNMTTISDSFLPISNCSSMIALNKKTASVSDESSVNKFGTFKKNQFLSVAHILNGVNNDDENDDNNYVCNVSDTASEESVFALPHHSCSETILPRGTILSSSSLSSLQCFANPIRSSSPISNIDAQESKSNFYGQDITANSSSTSIRTDFNYRMTSSSNFNGSRPRSVFDQVKPQTSSVFDHQLHQSSSMRNSLSVSDLHPNAIMKELTTTSKTQRKTSLSSNGFTLTKPTIPVKPNNLRNISQSKTPSPTLPKEINNNVIVNFDTVGITGKKYMISQGPDSSLEGVMKPPKPPHPCTKPNYLKTPKFQVKQNSMNLSNGSVQSESFVAKSNSLNKVQELVAAFNSSKKLIMPQVNNTEGNNANKYRSSVSSCRTFNRQLPSSANNKNSAMNVKFNSEWNLSTQKRCPDSSSFKPQRTSASHCGSVSDFLHKRSLLENKLPRMINVIGNHESLTQM